MKPASTREVPALKAFSCILLVQQLVCLSLRTSPVCRSRQEQAALTRYNFALVRATRFQLHVFNGRPHSY